MATLEKYLNLITSEHRVRPKYIAYVSALLKIAGDVEDLLAVCRSISFWILPRAPSWIFWQTEWE